MKSDRYILRVIQCVILLAGVGFAVVACSGDGAPGVIEENPAAVPEGSKPIRLISPMGLNKWEIGSIEVVEFMINGEIAGTAPRVELWKAEAEAASWVSEPSFQDVQHVRRSIEIVVPELPAGAYRVRVASTYDANIYDETERALIIEQ